MTGDVAGSVDHVDCDDLGTGLDDGVGMVVTSAGDAYFYYFDRSDTTATSSPDYIRCKSDSWTQGVWVLASTGGGSGTVDTSGTPVDDDWARFTDANTIEGLSDSEALAALSLEIGTDVQADLDVISQAEAEAGTATTERIWTAERVSQAIAALATGTGDVSATSSFGTDNVLIKSDGTAKGVQATGIVVDDNDVINPSDTPSYTGYHNTDAEDVFYIGMESGTKAATEADTILQGFTGDALSTFLQHDGGTDEVLSDKAMRRTNLADFGIEQETYTSGPEDLETNDPDVCRKLYVMSSAADANVEFDLQADTRCGGNSDVARVLYFMNNEVDNYDLILDPNSTDYIQLLGASTECSAGSPLYCGDDRSMVVLYGRTATVWQALVLAGTCACTSQQ